MKDLKVVFMGTPQFSILSLKALIENCNVIGVVCQPDTEGRPFSPVKSLALENNINVFQPVTIKTDYQPIIDMKPDIIITCAYGQIIPKELIESPRLGCINIHASLLPKLRGGAPIHRAIINGHSKTGITIMEMVSKMDAGAILRQREVEILDDDNLGILHNRLSVVASELIIDTLPDIISGNIEAIKQEESEVTFAPNISREDEHISFDKTKREVRNLIRGLNPWPGAYAILEGKMVKIWNAKIGEEVHFEAFNGQIVSLFEDGIAVKVNNGEIIITELQVEGRKKMSAKDFLNGLKDKNLLIGKIFD